MVHGAAERSLRLAAYLDAHQRDGITLSAISRDISGYDNGTAPRDRFDDLIGETPEWEAIRKKLRRDLDDLRTAWGVEVDYDEVAHCYRIAPPFLSARERAALISAAVVVAVEGIQPTESGGIGSGVDDSTARVVVQVHALVGALRNAIDSRTPLRFQHEGRERALEPWALGVWRNKWYVAGGDQAHDGEMRRFRLDRIEPVVAGGALEPAGPARSYTIPDWFDVDRAFDFDPNSWGHDAALDATVFVELDHITAFLHEFGGEVVSSGPAGAIVALVVRHHESFRNRLFGFRGHAVAQSPPELVALACDHLVAVALAEAR